MNISTETIGKWLAEGRNYGSIIVGFVGGIGLMSAAQQKGLTDALSEMANGISLIAHGASSFWQILIVAFPIIGVAFAKWAKSSASVDNQAAAVKTAINDPNTTVSKEAKVSIVGAAADLPEVSKVVAEPVLANAVPSDTVVTK